MKRVAAVLAFAVACGSSDAGTGTQGPGTPSLDGGVPDDTFVVTVDAVARRDVIQGQSYELAVHVNRASGIDVRISLEGLPKDAAASPSIIPGASRDGKISILTALTTPQGDAPMRVRASTDGHNDVFADVIIFVRGPAGSLDTTFNGKGFIDAPVPVDGVTGDGVAVFAFPDGSSIFGSPPRKFTASGALDTAYGDPSAPGIPIGTGRVFIDVDAQRRAYACKETGVGDECNLQRFLPNGRPDTAFNPTQTFAIGFVAYHPSAFFGDKLRILESKRGANNTVTDTLDVWQVNPTGETDMTWGGGVGRCFPYPIPNDVTIAEYAAPRVFVLPTGETVIAGGVRQKGTATPYTAFQARCPATGGVGAATKMGQLSGVIDADFTPDLSQLVFLTAGSENRFTNNAWSKFASNGNIDTTIGNAGYVDTTLSEARDVLVMSNGKIIIGGRSGSPGHTDVTLVRFNPDGSIDSAFGSQGRVVTHIGDGSNDAELGHMVIGPDGRIYVAASHYDVPSASFIRYWN